MAARIRPGCLRAAAAVAAAMLAGIAAGVAIAQPARAGQPAADPEVPGLLRHLNERGQRGGAGLGHGTGRTAPAFSAPRSFAAVMGVLGTDPAAVPPGNPAAAQDGFYGPPAPWPIIPIHMILLPDGPGMNYRTGTDGAQGAQMLCDVLTLALGTGLSAYMVLPNTTGTDLFCSAQSRIAATGQVSIAGGHQTVHGVRGFGNNHAEVFALNMASAR